jgi:uncharacterized protein (DUF1697 family)
MQFIALLRGINVGQKKVLMGDLKKALHEFGLKNIQTYIQTGNVIFETNKKADELSADLTDFLTRKFGFDIYVFITNKEELKSIVAKNPFQTEERLYVTLLHAKIGKTEKESLENFNGGNDELSFGDKVIYLYCPGGYGETKLSNSFFESKLKQKCTTRNWRTINKLIELSGS